MIVIFLNELKDFDKLVCYAVTKGQQTPQKMQLQAVLADCYSIYGLILVGSGSGETRGREKLADSIFKFTDQRLPSL
jgi:hypothetical protein